MGELIRYVLEVLVVVTAEMVVDLIRQWINWPPRC
jgi:hypothetical protein